MLTLLPTLLPEVKDCGHFGWRKAQNRRSDLVGRTGLEPVTPCVSSRFLVFAAIRQRPIFFSLLGSPSARIRSKMRSHEIFADGFTDVVRANSPSTQNSNAISDAILLTFARGPTVGFDIPRVMPVEPARQIVSELLSLLPQCRKNSMQISVNSGGRDVPWCHVPRRSSWSSCGQHPRHNCCHRCDGVVGGDVHVRVWVKAHHRLRIRDASLGRLVMEVGGQLARCRRRCAR